MKSLSLLLVFSIILIFAFLFFDEVRGQCLEHHKSVLLKFQHSLVIDESRRSDFGKSLKLANWDSSTDCCLWPGVTCSGAYVTGLDLSDEGIVDGFNDSSPLFGLTGLTSLNLAMMHQETVIPSRIGRLVNLMHLDMSSSGFIGQIPTEISNLTRLVSLDVSYCDDLKVENPNLRMLVGNLSNLIDFRLSRIDLSSQSREWCQALSSSTPRLQVLNLRFCELSGPIHDSLQNLTHLSIVDLSSNNFSGPIPYGVFASLENLTSLTMTSCEFNGVFPHTMFQLPTLRFLDISGNGLLEASPSTIAFQNSSLETLGLFGTRFLKTIPESIGEAKMLSHLDLSYCNLSGQIPESISQLEHLVYLDLSHNNLDGHIPSFSRSRNLKVLTMNHNQLNGSILAPVWKKLPQMERLILSWNSLSGSIPTCLFETPSLVTLDLEGNHFTGFTDEYNITTSSSQLVNLYLGHNDLQRPFPPFFYGLNNLDTLDLSFNNFSDTFHIMGTGSFIQLVTLDLASCNMKQFPPFLTNHSRLWNLDLSDNQIDGHIPDHIWNSTLRKLNVSHNRLQFLGRDELGLGLTLEFVDLSSNQFHGKIPNIQQPRIQYMDFSRNLFDSILTIGSFVFSMRFFSVSSNKLHGSIPVSICNATNVVVLDFSNNFFSGALPECLIQLPILGVLNLRNNNISGTIPDTLPSPCVLQTFDLGQNSFQGEIPKSLGRCDSLAALDLGHNKLHDMFPCWMTNVTMLTVLILRSNSLYGNTQCLNHNYNWSRLQIMDISSNNFVGKLPSRGVLSWQAMLVDKNSSSETGDLQYNRPHTGLFFDGRYNFAVYFRNTISVIVKGHQWNWTKISSIFTLVDFSDNKFEGDIPHELGELKFLYSLNLSHNYLNGRIPLSFGKLYRIESLDLPHNELSGKIPGQLASLNFLSSLNLSFNHLEGMIPKGAQFQTFTEASFEGNKGLCGQPLNTSCGNVSVSSPPNPSSEDNKFRDIFITTGIGYTVGLGLVIMPLIFWSRWRKGYYECTDKFLMNIFYCQPKKSTVSRKIRRRN